jgi:hypothetical protein
MIYTIINPSDEYTIESDDFLLACLAVTVLGNGGYALEDDKGVEKMPIFLFGGFDEWFTENFGKNVSDLFQQASPGKIADVLETIVIGSVSDRAEYMQGLEKSKTNKLKAVFAETWHDTRRSSMNDIRARALEVAKKLKGQK